MWPRGGRDDGCLHRGCLPSAELLVCPVLTPDPTAKTDGRGAEGQGASLYVWFLLRGSGPLHTDSSGGSVRQWWPLTGLGALSMQPSHPALHVPGCMWCGRQLLRRGFRCRWDWQWKYRCGAQGGRARRALWDRRGKWWMHAFDPWPRNGTYNGCTHSPTFNIHATAGGLRRWDRKVLTAVSRGTAAAYTS